MNMIDMERGIGETFYYNKTLLQVEERKFCEDCYFKTIKAQGSCIYQPYIKVSGHCEYLLRSDRKSVSFIKIK